MLLTVPWILAILGGRVDLVKKDGEIIGGYKQKVKLHEMPWSQALFETGVYLGKDGQNVGPLNLPAYASTGLTSCNLPRSCGPWGFG